MARETKPRGGGGQGAERKRAVSVTRQQGFINKKMAQMPMKVKSVQFYGKNYLSRNADQPGWRIEQKYCDGVLIGNWYENRLGKVCSSLAGLVTVIARSFGSYSAPHRGGGRGADIQVCYVH